MHVIVTGAALLLALVMVVSLAACGAPKTETTPNEAEPAANKDGLTFGWSVYDLANPFFIPMDEGVQAKCAELGITLLPTHDEKGDATEMITGVTALIEQGIDALTAISEGKMGGTVAQDPYGMGQLGVELAYKLCTGETLREDELDSDGNKVFLAPVKMIDNKGETIG